MLKRIFSTSFYSLAARLFSTATTLFIIFFISRFLNEEALGIYGIAFFFFQLFTVVSYKGLDVFFGKEVAFKRENVSDLSKLVNEFLVSIMYGTILSALLMLVFHIFYHKIGFTLLLLSLLTGILYALERNLGGFLLGKEKVSIDAFYMCLSFLTVVVLLFIFKHSISIEKIFQVRIGAFAVGVLGRWAAVSKGISLAKVTWKLKYFKETRFYWFLVLCVFAERHIDIFILSFFIEKSPLGGYFLSLSIYRTMSLVIEVLAQGLTPFISRVFQGKEKIGFERFVNYLFIASLLVGLLLGSFLFLCRDFIILLFNKNLISSCSPLLMLLSFAVPLKVIIFILGSVMSSTKYQETRFYINLYTSLVFVLLLLFLIYHLSVLGAVIARLVFEVLVFVAYFYFVFIALRRNIRNKINLDKFAPGSRPMRIGFDAKWFFSGNPSGRVIVRNILYHLLADHSQHDWYIFLRKEERSNDFPYKGPRMHLVYVWGKVNLLSNLLIVPLKAWPLKLDIMIYQYFAPLISNAKKVTLINDVIFKSNPEYFTLRERLYFSPMRFLARHSQRICTISHSEKRRLVYYGFSKEEAVDVIHLAADERFKPRKLHEPRILAEVISRYRLPERFLLYLGRLNVRKNLANLVRSIPLLKDRTIKLVLAGAYDWKTFDLRRPLKALGIEQRVILTGRVEDKYLPALYSLAEIFCYVSFDEGFGLPPLEAMAAGVPVVAANTGSLPEICAQAGTYVDPFKPEEIARAIDLLMEDKKLYEEKRRLGLERSKSFSWERSAGQLLEVCQKLVSWEPL